MRLGFSIFPWAARLATIMNDADAAYRYAHLLCDAAQWGDCRWRRGARDGVSSVLHRRPVPQNHRILPVGELGRRPGATGRFCARHGLFFALRAAGRAYRPGHHQTPERCGTRARQDTGGGEARRAVSRYPTRCCRREDLPAGVSGGAHAGPVDRGGRGLDWGGTRITRRRSTQDLGDRRLGGRRCRRARIECAGIGDACGVDCRRWAEPSFRGGGLPAAASVWPAVDEPSPKRFSDLLLQFFVPRACFRHLVHESASACQTISETA